eukprot:907934-Amphidinium_carterae.2
MDTGKPNFPVPAGSCGDCGHANVGVPPPGLYTPLPSHGLLQQTPSAATASPAVPGLNFSRLSGTESGCGASLPSRTPGQGYESFGEPPNNAQNPPGSPRGQRAGGDFPNDDDDDDDDGFGPSGRRHPRVIGWCDICRKNPLDDRLLNAYDVKRSGSRSKVHGGGGGGPPPDPEDPDDLYGGTPGWPKGRRERENREKKLTKEDVISKIASRILPKLEVKNPHDLSAIDLKLAWDTWLTQTFRKHLRDAQDRHAHWEQLPHAEKLQFERQYTYGLRQLPPIQEFLEGHMRHSLTQSIPSNIAAKLDAYGQYTVPDILFLLMKELFRMKRISA